jgi:hypothetical protein
MTKEHTYWQRLTPNLALYGLRMMVLVLLGMHRCTRRGRVLCSPQRYHQGGV